MDNIYIGYLEGELYGSIVGDDGKGQYVLNS